MQNIITEQEKKFFIETRNNVLLMKRESKYYEDMERLEYIYLGSLLGYKERIKEFENK